MYSLQERLGIATEPINGALYQWACMLRCAIPAIVLEFDPVKQTVKCQIAIQERVLLPPKATQNNPKPDSTANVPTDVAIHPIQDVPIVFPRVSGWAITMPITPGTECLLIFADMCIDGWWDTGEVTSQYDRRRHDLSDAFALFGPWSQPNRLDNYSTSSIQIRSDDQSTVVDIAPGQVTITGNLSVSSGATGTFTTSTGEVVYVQDGIIIGIE